MTIKECYEKIGGNYDDVVSRLRTDERIKKFLLRVADDGSFDLLVSSIDGGDIPTAFRAAHTLKGVCLNLSITRMFESASALTEALRDKTDVSRSVIDPLIERVSADHELTVSAIRALD